jgi:hypothetical protein
VVHFVINHFYRGVFMTSTFRKHLLKAFMLTSFLSTSHMVYAMEEDVTEERAEVPGPSCALTQTLAPHILTLQEQTDPKTIKKALVAVRDFLANNYLTEADNTIENWKKITQVISLAEYLSAYDSKGSLGFQNSTLDPHFIYDYLDKLTSEESEEVQNALSLLCSSVFISQELLSNPLIMANDLKRKFPSYPLRAKITSPEAEIPEWLKDNVLRLSLGERISGISFDEIFGAVVETFPKPAYSDTQRQELSAIHNSRLYSIISATATQPPKTTRAAGLYLIEGDGECGWYTADMTYNYALESLLQTVADDRIYTPSYYEVVLKRMSAVKGNAFFESLIEREGFTRDQDDLDGLKRVLEDKTARYTASLDALGPQPKTPSELQVEPEGTEEKLAWQQAVDDWKTMTWEAWRMRKDQLSKEYESSVWESQLGYIGDFRLPNDEIATFIQEDFPRRYPNKFVEFGISGGGDVADWFDILQHLEHINVQVWAPLEHPAFSSRKPMHITPDKKLGLLSLKYISDTAKHIGMLLSGNLPEQGHFSRLVCTNISEGRETTYWAEIAKAIRHQKRFNLK